MFQENGQRRYGGPPPDWDGPPPERGSEIFVGKLPRDLFEDELVPLCEKVRDGNCCIISFPHKFACFSHIFLNFTLRISSLARSTRWGWWWTSTGTTEVTPSSPSAPNRRPKQPWSSSTTTRSGQGLVRFDRSDIPENTTNKTTLWLQHAQEASPGLQQTCICIITIVLWWGLHSSKSPCC